MLRVGGTQSYHCALTSEPAKCRSTAFVRIYYVTGFWKTACNNYFNVDCTKLAE
jgi:hypothetical protein